MGTKGAIEKRSTRMVGVEVRLGRPDLDALSVGELVELLESGRPLRYLDAERQVQTVPIGEIWQAAQRRGLRTTTAS
jgi:hypothetical protein